jgi:lipopolysaccharide transport system ATP-binding protein
MYVRLAFAVAAHLEPEILVVDEVLAVGDAEFQQKCLGKMHEVSRGGRTVLFVSHNMAAVKSLCPKAILLEGGELTKVAPSDEVVETYLTSKPGQRSNATRLESPEGFVLKRDEGPEVHVNCGDSLIVDFTIECPMPLTHPSCGLIIRDRSGTPIAGMSSKFQKVYGIGPATHWNVRVDLTGLPLNAGDYSCKIYFGEGTSDLVIFEDFISIVVHEHDVYGYGNRVPQTWGPFYWKPDWSFKSDG